jgi:hypothetical protein
MATDYDARTGLNEMSRLPGISDLPSRVKVKFIKALREEAAGNHMQAQQFLDEAVAAEMESAAK